MTLIYLVIRAAVLLGLAAAFLVVFFNGLSRDARPDPPLEDRPALASTPSPTLIYPPTPLPSQDQVCHGSEPSPELTQIDVLSSQGNVIVHIYCSGTDLRYVTYVDPHGVVERTYLFEDGLVRVRLHYSGGDLVKREDFDEAGNLVPDGTYVDLPNNRIGPGLAVGQP